MKHLISTAIVAAMLLISGSNVGAQFSIGIRVGPPPPPRVVRVTPRQPGPGYVWVEGYYYPVGNKYRWHDGYWTRPPYQGARWVPSRYDGQMFYEGYWEGDRGRLAHNHGYDRDRNRDYRDDDRNNRR